MRCAQVSGRPLIGERLIAGRIAPSADMLDAVVAGDLEAAFTWSGYAAAKAAFRSAISALSRPMVSLLLPISAS